MPLRDEDLPPGPRSVVAQVAVWPTADGGLQLVMTRDRGSEPLASLTRATRGSGTWDLVVAGGEEVAVRTSRAAADVVDRAGRTRLVAALTIDGVHVDRHGAAAVHDGARRVSS